MVVNGLNSRALDSTVTRWGVTLFKELSYQTKMLKCANRPLCLVSIFSGIFSFLSVFQPPFLNSTLQYRALFWHFWQPNQYLRPPIFLEEGQFFLSIAKLQKHPLIPYRFPSPLCFSLFSLGQSLFKSSFKSPMLEHYPAQDAQSLLSCHLKESI